MKTILAVILISICSVTGALAQSASYDAQNEMTQDMRVIVNELKLDQLKIVEVGKIMEGRRDRKAVLANQIKALQEQMASEDARSEKEIKATLSDEQDQKYDDVVKPKLEALRQQK